MKDMAYNMIDNAPRNTHFAAVNSGKGFLSFFSQVFGSDRIKRRYIIKGGPGTGKSSFMRRVAEYAEARGREVEYYRCSSDPASLDGIIIGGDTAVIDGTSPHVYEPKLIGVEDTIINLCEFWNDDLLRSRRGEIEELSARRSRAYVKAYKFLSAVTSLNEINDSLTFASLDKEKMRAAVRRILRQVRENDRFLLEYGFVNAVGMSGYTHISSFEKKADRLYLINDSYGLSWHFLSEIIDGAMEKNVRVQVSYDPIEPHKPDGVYFPDDRIALLLWVDGMCEGGQMINMNRFIVDHRLRDVKAEYRRNRRMRDALMLAATDALSEAGKYHFELEDIYKSSMDFDAESRFACEFCEKYFG